MELQELLDTQFKFDKSRGWTLQSSDMSQLLAAMTDDVVGLLGELGEFSNILKKLKRDQEAALLTESEFDLAKPALEEELVDIFIYTMRMVTHLGIDLEQAYLNKLQINKNRFQVYEKEL